MNRVSIASVSHLFATVLSVSTTTVRVCSMYYACAQYVLCMQESH